MQKFLKYVPSGSVRTPIVFASSAGNVTFEYIGAEVTIPQTQFEKLLEEDSEFKACIELRVIVTSDVPDPSVKAGDELTEKQLTDTDEQLSATPKKSSKSTPSTT